MLLQTATLLNANPIKRGGKYIVHVIGAAGLTVTLTLGARKVTGIIDDIGDCYLTVTRPGLYTVTLAHGSDTVCTTELLVGTHDVICYKPFADCTPAEILEICNAGMYKTYWQHRDAHKIELDGGEEIYMEIADFDHDVRTDGASKIPITLVMRDCLATTYQLNKSNTNSGGWQRCYFRDNDLMNILSSFPAEWLKIMTECQKKTVVVRNTTNLVTTNETLWLLSETEFFGSKKWSATIEGEGYPIYNTADSRKKKSNGVITAIHERSLSNEVGTQYNGYFCRVGVDGAQHTGGAVDRLGICLGFCVG